MTISAATVGLLTAACGADGDDPLSKPEFVAQANAICQTTNDELNTIFEAVWTDVGDTEPDADPADETQIFARWDEAMDEVVPIVDDQLAEIRSLAFPAGDEELLETLLDDQEAAVDEFADLMEAAAGGDEAAMAALDGNDPFDDIDRRAREYGLIVCGESG